MSSAADPAFDDYQYQPLDHATQQIRLVTLLDPLENDDAIRLDIKVFEISEAPPYTALSYVWGPPPSSHDIYIANGRLQIRENLFKFLTEFRKCRDKMPSDQYLWIDQLCIDQFSTGERNHQVQMMSDIYSKATSVIAWLGDGSEKGNTEPAGMIAERGLDIFEDTHDAACAWKDRAEVKGFSYVLYNEYFQRLWIVQEFILARHIRILVKDVWLVNDTREWEYRVGTLNHYLLRSIPVYSYQIICKSSLGRIGRFIHLDIFAALDTYMENKCADQRDKVYGLLGLVRVDQRVTVDYEKSIDQLFMDVALAALRNPCLEGLVADTPTYSAYTVCWKAAHAMDITWARKANFDFRFYKICRNGRLGRFRGHACPITAVGLEKAAMTGREVDRFWFDFQGTRHFIYCTDEVTTLADETERLLQEDWEKYVPRDHIDETS